jgi:hypothetical protein
MLYIDNGDVPTWAAPSVMVWIDREKASQRSCLSLAAVRPVEAVNWMECFD